MAYFYRLQIPKGYTRGQKKEGELFIKMPTMGISVDLMKSRLSEHLELALDRINEVSADEYAEVAAVNVLPPDQLTLF